MKKILLILTGGTIGSRNNNGIISAEKGNCRAVEMYREKYGNKVVFEEVQPMNILSENIDKKHWEYLVSFILEYDISKFDGIIITHGSDTLSYSGAFLGLCLSHLNIPVVLTASNYVPEDTRSNAVENIRACVETISSLRRGFFIAYQNEGENFCSVYRPSQIREADRFRGHFSSFTGTIFGKVDENGFHQEEIISVPFEVTPPFGRKLLLKNDILVIKPYPTMLYSAVEIPESVKAVLLISYHSSTAKTEGKESALTLLKKCREKSVDLYITAVKSDSLYETSSILIKNGAIPIYNTSDEMSLALLLLKYNSQNG